MKSLSLREYLHYLECDASFLDADDHEKFRLSIATGMEQYLAAELDLRMEDEREKVRSETADDYRSEGAELAVAEALEVVATAQATVQQVLNAIEHEMHRAADAMKQLRQQVENI